MDGNGLFHRGVKNHQRAAGLLVVLLFCTNCIQPTGNLDEDTAGDITEILKESAHQMKKCVIVVTHSGELAKQADVVFRLKKGELQIEQSEKSS